MRCVTALISQVSKCRGTKRSSSKARLLLGPHWLSCEFEIEKCVMTQPMR